MENDPDKNIEPAKEISIQRNENSGFFSNNWKRNVVTDPGAPLYYSEKAVYMFSVFFTMFVGTIFLAFNIHKSGKKKESIHVLLFGILYTAAGIWLLSLVPRNTGLTIGFNVGGAVLLNQFFWKKHLGGETKYRTRSIWMPLVICLAATTLFILSLIYSDNL